MRTAAYEADAAKRPPQEYKKFNSELNFLLFDLSFPKPIMILTPNTTGKISERKEI